VVLVLVHLQLGDLWVLERVHLDLERVHLDLERVHLDLVEFQLVACLDLELVNLDLVD
jgi:hypothetical protein